MGVGWYLSLANFFLKFDAIGGNVLTKGFCNKKMECGSDKNDYMHIKETKQYLDKICGIY